MGEKRHLLSVVLQETSDAIAVCDSKLRVSLVNRAFEQLLGHDTKSLAEKSLFELTQDCNDPALSGAIERALDTAGEWQGELSCCGVDGAVYQSEAALKQCGTDYVLLLKDLSRRNTPIGSGPQHDALTGLPNRYLLKDRLEQALVTAKRSSQSVAVLTIGLDHFTRINDGLGHEFGDSVLIEIARRLKATLRRSDTVARTDGDTFVLVLPMRSANDSVTLADKLLNVVNERLELSGQVLNLTASIGLSVAPTDTEEGDGLLKRAGSAMHHAKKVGRNCYQYFAKEMNIKARQRIDMENDLRRALEHEEFVLYYQPKVRIETGDIIGAEALIRWLHPERGLVVPSDFIPTAEESGLIHPIGNWVMGEACRQNSVWQAQGLPPVRMSVNMAAPQFHAGDLVDRVSGLLGRYLLPPEYLELEITETMLMGNPDQVRQRLKALREIGVGISIDDFGTGYSSLSYLAQFPITTLKIDRSFICDLTANHNTAEITRAIIGLSKGLALEVVAEGVETAEHIDFLQEHGCSTVQGFYYSRPVPAVEFEQLMGNGALHPALIDGSMVGG